MIASFHIHCNLFTNQCVIICHIIWAFKLLLDTPRVHKELPNSIEMNLFNLSIIINWKYAHTTCITELGFI